MEQCDPRVYLAAERTFLAWIRTGLALMGFGFIVARLSPFLREGAQGNHITAVGVSQVIGIILILLGIIVNVCAARRHHCHIRALDRGEFRGAFGSTFTLFITAFLTIIGLALALYLILI